MKKTKTKSKSVAKKGAKKSAPLKAKTAKKSAPLKAKAAKKNAPAKTKSKKASKATSKVAGAAPATKSVSSNGRSPSHPGSNLLPYGAQR